MKISKNTQKILNNFSGINISINIKAGSNKLSVMSNKHSELAVATVDETFPADASIYSLPEFLKSVSLFEDPDFEFDELRGVISEGNTKLNYTWAPKGLVADAAPMPQPKVVGEFTLTEEMIGNIKTATATLKLDRIKLISDGSTLTIKTCNSKNPDRNSYEIIIGDCPVGQPYNLDLISTYLKMIPGDYTVKITNENKLIFSHQSADLVYMSALEATSVLPK